ncbi:MAG TPA: PDZ domain-containing protein [Thermodesulfovibrionales bacterium]|nr:PDZ domain-containing protein [Thermodesulfovibrionales bacterium]
MISKCLHYVCSIGFIVFALLLVPLSSGADDVARRGNVVHHDIKITIHPQEHRLIAEDLITLPDGYQAEVHFTLHSGLDPSSLTPGVSIVREGERSGHVPVESYRARLPQGQRKFRLTFGGTLFHPGSSEKAEARGFSQTPGIVSEEGLYLAESSAWYPLFDEPFITFTLNVHLPPEWDAVSQGERVLHAREEDATRVIWESPEPQEEIFLIGGRFTEYTKQASRVMAMVFLRTPDRELAEKYLDATARYISMYEKLIGPYPYKKFALVENFWETGFGMPSFTLLGPTVIRLPFIVDTSYPHEILHNWWGNSVFPDYAEGNWSEGLTAYLADHFMKEQQGSGAEYRETTLQKYADYVLGGRDFPLTQFRSRHSSSSEAIGYGKALMFFHMLRQELGDEVFRAGLRDFYGEMKFRYASFDDLRRSFEKVSAKDLKTEFSQWITRTGAPEIKVTHGEVRKEEQGYILSARIEQVQVGEAYHLRVPVAVTLQGQERAYQTTIIMDKKVIDLAIPLPSRPLRFDVDPEFDLFRRLNREEIPPALSQSLGAKRMLIILPSSAKPKTVEAYRDFASSLANSGPDEVDIRLDRDIDRLPSDRAVTVLGWENLLFSQTLTVLSAYGVSMKKGGLFLGKAELPQEDHSFVLVARNPANKEVALTFIASSPLEALPGLARKLPHYRKYSYLGFTGIGPTNVAKGRWPVTDSPMAVLLADKGSVAKVKMGELASREPLLAAREKPLTATAKNDERRSTDSGKERKVSLGTVPDFGFGGKGYRLSGVVPGSPADACGLKEGDIIIRINSTPVAGLKDLSDILKSLVPGTSVSITFMRDGKEMTVETEVKVKER